MLERIVRALSKNKTLKSLICFQATDNGVVTISNKVIYHPPSCCELSTRCFMGAAYRQTI